jgi:hypothetical protein
MMRAALILVGLGTLVAMELEAPPRTRKAVNEPLAQSTVGLSASHDSLTKADRLEIPYVQYDAPAQRISPVERRPPPDPKAIIPQEVIGAAQSLSCCLNRGLSTQLLRKLQIPSAQR